MKYPVVLLTAMFVFLSCEKNNSTSEDVDTSKVYYTDFAGNPYYSDTLDGQWKSKNFDDREITLFTVLDTANLSGTTKPSYLFTGFGYPSPFNLNFSIPVTFNLSFNGRLIIKFVIVDSKMNVIERGTRNVQAVISNLYNTSRAQIPINPNLSKGKYRLYLTVSSENNNHFYKTWGNIEKL